MLWDSHRTSSRTRCTDVHPMSSDPNGFTLMALPYQGLCEIDDTSGPSQEISRAHGSQRLERLDA